MYIISIFIAGKLRINFADGLVSAVFVKVILTRILKIHDITFRPKYFTSQIFAIV